MKNLTLLKKIFAITLALIMLATDILNTVSYAQSMPASPKSEKVEISHETLITDTIAAPLPTLEPDGRTVKTLVPMLDQQQASNLSAGVVIPAKVRKLARADFSPNEDIDVVIENGADKEYKTELIDAIGNKVALDIDEIETGAAKVITLEQPSSFKPGMYTLRISDGRGGISEQDFSWGVLAVNPDKSVYAPNETANLAFGVLDEGGNMVCNAQVELTITSQAAPTEILSTDNGKIKVNPECESHDFTLNPDYSATYTVGGKGTYIMSLKSQTRNGSHTITDSFEVRDVIPFDVKRLTATRIYPPHTYPVTMEITANQDFEGTITETVPASFKISRPGEAVKSNTDKVEEMVKAQEEEAEAESTAAPSSQPSPSEGEGAKKVPSPFKGEGQGEGEKVETPQPAVQAPDNLPQNIFIPGESVIGYSTINDLQANSGVKAVLGASVPGLGMPFSGAFPVSQEFGESLVYDMHDHDLYDTFGMHGHDGIDFAMPEGTPLIAVDAGRVILAGAGDYGTTIVIQHSWGRSYYGHLSGVSIKDGDEVTRGQTIGSSGNTGISTGPHLHFGIKPDTNDGANGYYGKVDPAYYLGMKQSAMSVLGVSTSSELSDTQNSALQNPDTDVKILTWKVNVKKGEKIKIGYNYLAPRISPQFYTLGPATFTDSKTGKEVFREIRKWQIAADALEYKFKQGTFTKSTCSATCTQRVNGVGFKPKAIIFEWTQQTTETTSSHMNMGVGFGTMFNGIAQERSAASCSTDNVGTSDSGRYRSDTKVIVFMSQNCAAGTAAIAVADLVSFDNDGFTLSWTTNNFGAYKISYTALGGSDISNAKAGSFTLGAATGSQSITDPGFQPDFLITQINGNDGASDDGMNTALSHAGFQMGFAAGPTKQGSVNYVVEDGQTTTDTWTWQKSDAIIAAMTSDSGSANTEAQFTSFDSTGFTLFRSNSPGVATTVFYLALQGGQYDVGTFLQPSSNGPQSITTPFKPSGVMLMTASNSASQAISANAAFSLGAASANSATSDPWCNDTSDITCTGPGTQAVTNNTPTDWCNDTSGVTCTADWSTRKKITFNNATGSGTLTDFPVLVKLDSTRIDYTKTQGAGQDLRFVDPSDPTTALPHEIERWDEFGTSYVWVKVPSLEAVSGADFIWMYYGNSSVSDGQAASSVWDTNFKLVQHLEELNPSSTCSGSSEACDSTSNANHANGTSLDAADQVSGKVNGAFDFDGSAEYLNGSLTGTPITTTFTMSAWINPDNASSQRNIIGVGVAAGNRAHLSYWTDSTFYCSTTDASPGLVTTGTQSTPGTWNHVVCVQDATSLKMYINGELVAAQASTITIATNNYSIGSDVNAPNFLHDGKVDEVRLSSSARTHQWVQAEYLTASDQMNTFGTEEYNNTWCNDASGITCNSSWGSRKKITFDDNTASSGAVLKDFPVLVKLNSSRINFSKTQDDGDDLRFVDPGDPSTVLPHEIEGTWTESGDNYVWVKIPQLDPASGNDFVWMYYNNSSASSGQDAANVWESNYRNVYHMNGTNGSATIADSATNNSTENGTKESGTGAGSPVNYPNGMIGGTQDFVTPDYVQVTGLVGSPTNLTLEAWIDLEAYDTSNATIISIGDYVAINAYGGGLEGFFYRGSATWEITNVDFGSYDLVNDGWTKITYTMDDTNNLQKLYVNNILVGQDNYTQSIVYTGLGSNTQIGRHGNAETTQDLDGRIDEVRISSAARSTDWVKAEYASQTDRMNTFGMEQNYGEKNTDPQGWAYRKKITFNNASSSADLNDFPALVKLNMGRIDYNKTQDSGQDLRFVDPSNPSLVLPHEIETWNESGESIVWVKIPQIDGNSNSDYIWMYYGNRYAPDGQNPTLVWNSGYEGVWHLKEDPGVAGTGQILDATSNNNDGTDIGSMNGSDSVTAKIGKGLDFDGSNDYVEVPFNSDFRLNGSFSIEFWTRFTGAETVSFPSILGFGSGSNDGWLLYETAASNNLSFKRDVADGTITPNNSVDSTTFRHYTVTYDETGGMLYSYVNGAQVDSGSETYPDDVSTNVLEMANGDDVANIILDEVRISSTFRDPDWIEASFLSQADGMNTFGPEETPNGAANQYSQSNIWFDDLDAQNTPTSSVDMSNESNKILRTAASPTNGTAPRTTSEAEIASLDSTGFTLNWTTTDSTARAILYWTAGSVTASQDDYRWFKNTNGISPDTALEDENSSTIIPKSKPYARLRANMSVGGNGMNASTQGFKLQYASDKAVAGSSTTTDWCNDTTGVTCTAPNTNISELPTAPADWCNDTSGVTCTSDWSSRRQITFNNASSSAALTNFPVLVKLDSTRINYNKTQNNGEDIRFVDPSNPNVALDHEIESWNESGSSYVWVEVPQIDGRSTTDSIWMYYGNANITDGQNASGVWDSNYRMVYHMNDSTGATMNDSTSNNKDGSQGTAANQPIPRTTGQINGNFEFDDTGSSATADTMLVSSPNLPTGDFTWSVWVNPDAVSDETIAHSGNTSVDDEFSFEINSNKVHVDVNNSGGNIRSNASISTGTWTHITVSRTLSTGLFSIYLNGQLDPAGTSITDNTSMAFSTCNLNVGFDADNAASPCSGTPGNWFDGDMDELRASATVRNSDWIQAEYMTGTDSFNTYGTEFTKQDAMVASSGWQYRKKITFNNASSSANLTSSPASESGNLKDFPVLVKLDSSRIDYTKTQDNGGDIRFVDPSDNTTVLPHEIESWSEASSSAVWVKVPEIDANSTTDYIWMYYGNPGAPDGQNPTGVWDNDFNIVYHMDDSGGTIADSAGTAQNGTATGATATAVGQIGGAQDFDGTNDHIQSSNSPGLPTGDFTYSAWVSFDDVSDERIFMASNGSGQNEFTLAEISSNGQIGVILGEDTSGTYDISPATTTVGTGKWNHIVFTRNGSTIRVYVNGTQDPTTGTDGGVLNFSTCPLMLGVDVDSSCTGGLSNYLNGRIDEARVSGIARQAEWIEAEYLNGLDRFNTFEEEQPYSTSTANNVLGWQDVADPWCNDTSGVTCSTAWQYRKKINFNTTAASGSAALDNFPVLVKLDPTRIDYTKVQDNGADIRFVDPNDPTVVLDYEIESWNEQGTSFVWVEVPSVSVNTTSDGIWMYYGNSSASDGQNGTGVWNSSYAGVWHLKENPTITNCPTTKEVCDSTSNAFNADSAGSMTNTDQVAGKVNGSLDFDGSNDAAATASTTVFDTSVAFTIEAWINPRSFGEGSGGNIFSKEDSVDFYIDDTSNNLEFAYTINGQTAESSTNAITTNTWQHVAIVYNGSNVATMYVNGVDVTADSSVTEVANAAATSIIGSEDETVSSFTFDGGIDEVRVLNTSRTSDWMKVEYLTQADQMNIFGTEETQSTYAWKFKDNSSVSNAAVITSSKLGTSASGNQMHYFESNANTVIPTALAVGERREWDFSLDGSNASNRRTYYFRLVRSDGKPLSNYTRYPSITVGVPQQKMMRGGKFFNYKQSQPFTF